MRGAHGSDRARRGPTESADRDLTGEVRSGSQLVRGVGAVVLASMLAACAFGTPRTERPVGSPSVGPTGPTQVAHVTKITDGDTIHVDIDGQDYRSRYIGMDTPESVKPGTPVEPYAKAAAAANAALVADRDVVLEKDVSETDRYGRLLRYVWLRDDAGWTMVNLELVRTGYANVLTYPPDVKYAAEFVAAEREAREAGRGYGHLPGHRHSLAIGAQPLGRRTSMSIDEIVFQRDAMSR